MKSKRLMTALAVVAVLLACAGVATYTASPDLGFTAPNPHLTADGYHKADQRYVGPEEHRFNGELLASHSQPSVEEYGITPAGKIIHPSPVGTLLDAATEASLVVTDYIRLDSDLQNLSVEKRAILDVRSRVERSDNVNVLVGRLYGLRVNSYQDFASGSYNTKTATFHYENSLLYVERQLDGLATVVVTSKQTSEGNWRAYLTRGMSNPPSDSETFNSVEGVTTVTKLHPSRFVEENKNFRVWSARQVHRCEPNALSSRCLYKAYQKDSTHQGHQQVVLVAKAGTLEINKPLSPGSDLRFIRTVPAVKLANGQLLQVGVASAERTKNKSMRNPTQQMTALLQGGGTVFDERKLSEAKAFSFN